jgi:hypothetical protein
MFCVRCSMFCHARARTARSEDLPHVLRATKSWRKLTRCRAEKHDSCVSPKHVSRTPASRQRARFEQNMTHVPARRSCDAARGSLRAVSSLLFPAPRIPVRPGDTRQHQELSRCEHAQPVGLEQSCVHADKRITGVAHAASVPAPAPQRLSSQHCASSDLPQYYIHLGKCGRNLQQQRFSNWVLTRPLRNQTSGSLLLQVFLLLHCSPYSIQA